MKNNAKVVVCQKHDELYNTGQGGYEYDQNLWEDCPLCWLFSPEQRGNERKVAEKFSLDLKPGELVEVWFARSTGSVSLQNALASIDPKIKPAEYEGPKLAFEAIVESYLLTPDGPDVKVDPNWEWCVIKSLTGGKFLCDRVPWPGARMEFAGAHPEDAEWSIRVLPRICPMAEDGLPADEVFEQLQETGDSCRIYRKEVQKQ